MTQWKQRPWTLGESSPISLLFAVLLDLIICRTTKMGLFVPSRAAGRPQCRIRRDGSQDQGRQALEIAFWRKILAYLKWLIYSAAFKGPTAEPHGSIHAEFTEDGTERFEPVKILSAESRRSSWIAGMPRICKEKSIPAPRTMTTIWELPKESMSSCSRFIMTVMIHDSQRMLHDCQQGFFDGGIGNWKMVTNSL